MDKPRKIIICGMPGTGKSTFAGIISEPLNLPVINIDSFGLDENGRRVANDIVFPILDKMLNEDEWIVDGMYSRIADQFIDRADLIVYIKINVFHNIMNLAKRYLIRLFNPKPKITSGNNKNTRMKNLKGSLFRRGKVSRKWSSIIDKHKEAVEVITLHSTNRRRVEKFIQKYKNVI